jgi:pyruvate,orthophosphate dikinase
MQVVEATRTVRFGNAELREGEVLTLDGNEGAVYRGEACTATEPLSDLQARLRDLRGKCRSESRYIP